MLLACSRYLALFFAIGLGIGEATINWGGWQYTPLWVVDYIVVAGLLWSFFKTRTGRHLYMLVGSWAFAAGIFYMALFVNLDPEMTQHVESNGALLVIVGFMLVLCVIGSVCAVLAIQAQQGTSAKGSVATARPSDRD